MYIYNTYVYGGVNAEKVRGTVQENKEDFEGGIYLFIYEERLWRKIHTECTTHTFYLCILMCIVCNILYRDK